MRQAVACQYADTLACIKPQAACADVHCGVVCQGCDGVAVQDRAGCRDGHVGVAGGDDTDRHLVKHVVADVDADVAVDRVQGGVGRHGQAARAGLDVHRARTGGDDIDQALQVDRSGRCQGDVAAAALDVCVGQCHDVGSRSNSLDQDVAGAVGYHCCISIEISGGGAFTERD